MEQQLKRIFIFLIIVICLNNCFAAPVTIRTSAQDNTISKYNLTNPSKPGICIEIIRAIEKVDAEIKFTGLDTSLPLVRIESYIAEGKLDGFVGVLKTDERMQKLKYIDPAIFTVKHMVAVKVDDKIELKNLDDLKKAAGDGGVMTTKFTGYVSFLEKAGIKVDAGVNNNSDIIKKLLVNRGRFFYQADINLTEYIEKENAQDKIRILPTVFNEEGQFIVFGKAVPESTVAKVQAAVLKLEQTGELKKIFAKYVKL